MNHNMTKKMLEYCLLILLVVPSAAATENMVFDTYKHAVELKEDNSFHKIDAIMNALQEYHELNVTLPLHSAQVKLVLDDLEQSCPLEEQEGFSLVHCSFPKGLVGKHILQLTYETAYPLLKVQNRILYKDEYLPPSPTLTFYYILKLPVGFVIPKEKAAPFFINPKPTNMYSDGQRIILSWERTNVTSAFELSAMLEPVGKSSSRPVLWTLGILALILLIAGVILLFRRLRKKELTYPALIEQEQVLVNILKKKKGQAVWQKQLQLESGFSKVKVSRIIRSLEGRGVIKKEPGGNTNKIYLVASEGEAPTKTQSNE